MITIYSPSTIAFIQEITKMSKITHNKSDRHLTTKKQLRGVRKLYEADTSKFEPIPENREHLIKTLLPMVISQAKKIANKYNANITYEDCISAGNLGATIATDIYISKSTVEQQPAKLSTYAFSYIVKYINEYCWSVTTVLSHGPTKLKEANTFKIMQGNQSHVGDGGIQSEFFDFANDDNLMTVESHDHITDDIETVSKALFSKLTLFDKEVIFLRFGIGSEHSAERQPRDIAKILKKPLSEVLTSLEKSIINMKNSIPPEEIFNVIDTIKSSNINTSKEWQRIR